MALKSKREQATEHLILSKWRSAVKVKVFGIKMKKVLNPVIAKYY